MTPTVRKNARTTSARRTIIETRRLINSLHSLISDIIIDPRDENAYHRADDICQEIWQWCTSIDTTPWSLCLDRYCSCKLMLSEWEPQALPGLDTVRGQGPRQGGL